MLITPEKLAVPGHSLVYPSQSGFALAIYLSNQSTKDFGSDYYYYQY